MSLLQKAGWVLFESLMIACVCAVLIYGFTTAFTRDFKICNQCVP